ncbi:MAG: hypothetical protein EON89_04765 [Brevundimonas sp.]|nr:MAG: hypothetical protein EON89_04765 [Brevundimonas sp.]
MRRPTDLFQDETGGIAVMAAAGGLLSCIMAGLVIDGGSIALQARRMQSTADLAALAAAADLPRAHAAAEATARANFTQPIEVRTVTGVYLPDRALAPAARFRSPSDGASPNAARVTVSGSAPVFFARLILGRDTVIVTRTGSAASRAAEPTAMLSIGSRLARLDGGVANQVLSGLTGSNVKLSVMDYEALADADVNLLTFTDALATRAGVTAGDYDRLADVDMDAGEALRIVEAITDGADSALNRLAKAADGQTLRVGDLIGVETGAPAGLRGGLNATTSVMDLAGAALQASGGDRQVRLDLGARAGLADVDVWLAIGERPNQSPWVTVGHDGQVTVRTAQARVYVEARTAQSLSGLGQVRLPVLLELAPAEARLKALDCGAARSVDVAVRPGVARARVGAVNTARLDDFKTPMSAQPATLLSVLGLVSVKASADVEAADTAASTLRFDARAISDQAPKTIKSTGFASGAVSSLLGRLTLDVDVAGLGLGLGNLTSALNVLLHPLGPVLDGLVDGVLTPLGLSLGEADVTVHGLSCPDQTGAVALVG